MRVSCGEGAWRKDKGGTLMGAIEETKRQETEQKEQHSASGEKKEAQDAAPEIVLQYRGYEVDVEAVTERVKNHYYAKGYKKGTIKSLQIYMKPEEFTAYYVINDGVVGKVNLFYD